MSFDDNKGGLGCATLIAVAFICGWLFDRSHAGEMTRNVVGAIVFTFILGFVQLAVLIDSARAYQRGQNKFANALVVAFSVYGIGLAIAMPFGFSQHDGRLGWKLFGLLMLNVLSGWLLIAYLGHKQQ